jgi:chitodextrinase
MQREAMWNAASTSRRRGAFLLLLVAAAFALAVSATANGARKPPKPRNDTRAPSAPSGLRLNGATGASLTLSWSASRDNVGVAGYELYLNSSKVGTTSATSYGFSGLSCGRSYNLAVDAYDAAGNRSSKSAVQASTSPCPDTQAPTTPSSLVKTSSTASSISLSWAASLDNVGVAGYTVYASGTKAGTTGQTLYSVTNLACGHSYTVGVDAYDAAGNHSSQASVVASTAPCPSPPPAPAPAPDTQAPTTPTLLVETSSTASSVSLSWATSLDNVGVAGYTVYASGTKAGTTGQTLYSVTNLACGHSYTVGVDAYDAAGNHSSQASVVASTAPCPSPPTNSALPAISGATTVGSTLSATQGAWSGNPTSYGYQWRRCDGTGNTCSDISGAGTSTYTLTGADQASTLRVAVTATNTNGSSTVSSLPTAVIAAGVQAPTTPAASAGQTICLHGGTYSGGISYGSSGAAGSPITIKSYPGETALISGPSGGTALKLNGSYVKLDSLRVDNALYGIDIVGDGVEVANSTVLHAGFGIFTEASADKTYVHDSTFTDNNREIVNTPCSVNCNDDYGAQAFEISGTNGHFSHNTVTGSWSVSYDYPHDGDAFEIWGGSGNLIEYNFGQNNDAFAELGKPSTRVCDNNHFYYNVVVSSLPFGVDGIDAHGNEGFGPCNGTQVFNNSIFISSPTSEPLRCGSCTSTMMTLRNNAVRTTGSGDVYNLSSSNEDYNILSGVGAPSSHGAHTITSDPLFVSATNLDTQTSSPARGAGTLVGLTSDFLGIPVPVGGATDIGAFEH